MLNHWTVLDLFALVCWLIIATLANKDLLWIKNFYQYQVNSWSNLVKHSWSRFTYDLNSLQTKDGQKFSVNLDYVFPFVKAYHFYNILHVLEINHSVKMYFSRILFCWNFLFLFFYKFFHSLYHKEKFSNN